METEREMERLSLKLTGYTKPGQELYPNILFDQLYRSLPKDPEVKVQIYNAEIAPGGYTNWHCHNGATFFIALQGVFEAHFEEGVSIRAKGATSTQSPLASSIGATIRIRRFRIFVLVSV